MRDLIPVHDTVKLWYFLLKL